MRAKDDRLEITTKDRVLNEFEKICNQIGSIGLLDVKQDSPLVYAVDLVLQNGLRDPVRGYWNLVRSLTHSTTLKSLEAFVKYISSSQQKGLAWTFYTMEEGSLEYYLSSLLQDPKTLQQYYLDQSLLRDKSLSQQVVSTITFMRSEAAAMQTSIMESSLLSEASSDQLVSSSPFLTSPVDSGVALSTSDIEKPEEYINRRRINENQCKYVLGSSVATETSTSSDNTLADSDLHNANTSHEQEQVPDNKAKSGIISQNVKYDGVCRRPRKKKKSESGKRVSFHQDSNDDSERDPNMNKFYVEGRYSWAGEGDNFFMKESNNIRQIKSEVYETKGFPSSISIFESEMGIEADCDSSTTTIDDAKHNIELVCEKLSKVVKQSLGLRIKEKPEAEQNINRSLNEYKYPLMAEREGPEGQEDPEACSEYHWRLATVRSSADFTSDSESLDTADKLMKKYPTTHTGIKRIGPCQLNWPSRILQEAPSKTSLVKRFLRSIPTKKPFKEKKHVKKSNLYIKGAKPNSDLSRELLMDLKNEMGEKKSVAKKEDDEFVTDEMEIELRKTVFMNKDELLYKVYRVASTEGVPLLAVLTDTTLYMTGLNSNNNYSRRHHINYHTLDTVVIGPEYQTVMLVTVDHSVTVTVISALGQSLVTHMISHLAVAVSRVTHSQLSVCQLSLSNMQALYKAVLTQSSVTKEEKLHYYRYIRVEDSHMTGPYVTVGPSKCGDLMYRSHNHSPWLPGYIVLKGGVLYVFSDAKQQRPKHVLSFHVGYFGGCRRVLNSNRPHTFEILPFSQQGLYGTFQFAAADDYEASEWLQMFIQTSYSMCQSRWSSEDPLTGCGLLMTTRHLLTLDFPDKVLSCARLQDITTIRTATTCCILETSCREVQENCGDWILYFLSEQAISEFLEAIYLLRPELQQAVVNTWECEALRNHCIRTSQLVTTAWDPLLRPSVSQSGEHAQDKF